MAATGFRTIGPLYENRPRHAQTFKARDCTDKEGRNTGRHVGFLATARSTSVSPTPEMDPRRSAQEVLLCDACETVPLQSHCDLCNISLCTNCVGKYLLDSSRKHRVVPFTERKSTPNYPACPKHGDKHCELYCEKCDVPVCITCVSDEHKGHNLCEVLKTLGSKTQALQKDLEELESRIRPRYEEMASDVQTEKAGLQTNYEKLTRDADQLGEILHREVTAIVNQRKSDIAEMKTKHMAALDKNTEEITHSITEVQQMIVKLKEILESNDLSLISSYKSRNNEFRRLPPNVRVTLPSFSPQKIHTEQLRQMLGSLSSLSINTEEHGDTMTSADPPVKPLIDDPCFTATIDTGYRHGLRSVSCLSEEQVWTCGLEDNTMKLLNLQSERLTSIQTKSGGQPWDITVTRDGDLVYTERYNKTINLVKNKKTRTVITLQGWWPLCVCCTAANHLLVTMVCDDRTQSKVVRYSGSTETQTIQYDDQGRPLYSSDPYNSKYISENRNLDICVADYGAKDVVVVNQSGTLRFRYTGHPSNTGPSFDPVGIATDSQGHILTAANGRIHILDQDGQFLRYIHNLRGPWGLCVDSRDNLFVAECHTAKVKRIQYLESQC